jgi:hypothetical protein
MRAHARASRSLAVPLPPTRTHTSLHRPSTMRCRWRPTKIASGRGCRARPSSARTSSRACSISRCGCWAGMTRPRTPPPLPPHRRLVLVSTTPDRAQAAVCVGRHFDPACALARQARPSRLVCRRRALVAACSPRCLLTSFPSLSCLFPPLLPQPPTMRERSGSGRWRARARQQLAGARQA